MNHISMTAYQRPEYTQEVLTALANCQGIGDWRMTINLEPGYEEVADVCRSFDACDTQVIFNRRRLKLNKNTYEVLGRAKKKLAASKGINLHIEDDTVLAPDALKYVTEVLEEYGDHPKVFSVACYNKPSVEPTSDQWGEIRVRQKFTCWAWAVRYSRLQHILNTWCTKNEKSFAWNVERRSRQGLYEIHPQLSRVQNIGYLNGANERTEEWYRDNHRTPWVADADVVVSEWNLKLPPNSAFARK